VEWNVLPHPSYSPDLAPSDFHRFGPLTDTLGGSSFADNDELEHNVREKLRRFRKGIYATGIQRLTQRWKKCVDSEEDFDFVEKLSQFCKGCAHDRCKFNFNYIVIVIIVSD
jgi:hypothetical protein